MPLGDAEIEEVTSDDEDGVLDSVPESRFSVSDDVRERVDRVWRTDQVIENDLVALRVSVTEFASELEAEGRDTVTSVEADKLFVCDGDTLSLPVISFALTVGDGLDEFVACVSSRLTVMTTVEDMVPVWDVPWYTTMRSALNGIIANPCPSKTAPWNAAFPLVKSVGYVPTSIIVPEYTLIATSVGLL